jgi:acyl-CoA thioesterase I
MTHRQSAVNRIFMNARGRTSWIIQELEREEWALGRRKSVDDKKLKAIFRSFVIVSAFAVASVAQAGGLALPKVAHRLAKRQPLTIVAFGSSSTQGVGATSPHAAYPAVLQRDLDETKITGGAVVLNRGIGGQDADDMMRRIDQDAVELRPDLVIWQTGSNDPLRGVPLDRFKQETTDAILKLKSAGIDVMLLEPQWCRVFDRTPNSIAYRDAVREVGADVGVPVIKRSTLMKTWLAEHLVTYDQLLARDGLHMTDGGYALLAKEIEDEILSDAGYGAPAIDNVSTVTPHQAPASKTAPAS